MNLLNVMTDEQGREFTADYFQYSTPPVTLNFGASTSVTFQIEADAVFQWIKTSFFADVAGAAQTASTIVVPLVTVAITDSGSGRNLQNRPIPLAAMAGDLGLPHNLPVPRLFKPQSTITVTLTNNSAATNYANLTLVFEGIKRFYK